MNQRMSLRLYVAFLGVLLAVMVVSAAINFFTGRTMFGLMRGGPRLAAHVGRMLPPLGDLQGPLDEIHDELGFDLAVVAPDGDVVAASGNRIEVPGPGWLDRARGRPGWMPGRVVAGPVRNRPGLIILVHIPVPTAAFLRPLMLLAAVLVVSFALVYPLSRSITRPIEKLTAAVEAYGRGDLKKRSGLGDLQDEVGRLARAFDEMAERIEATRRTEKELLANASHELRTPLARIKVALALMEPEDQKLRDRIETVSQEVDELDRLVGDVLTAARLEVAALPLHKARLSAGELVGKARERALSLDPSLHVHVRADSTLSLDADEGLLARALDNLLDNARKYGKGPVEIEATRDGANAVLSVRDHGAGISSDEIERVFDPFFRGSATRGASEGFGLGLALAKRVAEAHEGSVRATNAPDGGARIELRLPAAA